MNNKIVLNRAAFIFFLFCFLLVIPFSQYIDLILSSSISFFLIIIFGISHGALDHEKGYKLLRIYEIKNTIIFFSKLYFYCFAHHISLAYFTQSIIDNISSRSLISFWKRR